MRLGLAGVSHAMRGGSFRRCVMRMDFVCEPMSVYALSDREMKICVSYLGWHQTVSTRKQQWRDCARPCVMCIERDLPGPHKWSVQCTSLAVRSHIAPNVAHHSYITRWHRPWHGECFAYVNTYECVVIIIIIYSVVLCIYLFGVCMMTAELPLGERPYQTWTSITMAAQCVYYKGLIAPPKHFGEPATRNTLVGHPICFCCIFAYDDGYGSEATQDVSNLMGDVFYCRWDLKRVLFTGIVNLMMMLLWLLLYWWLIMSGLNGFRVTGY